LSDHVREVGLSIEHQDSAESHQPMPAFFEEVNSLSHRHVKSFPFNLAMYLVDVQTTSPPALETTGVISY
jgi:hypothetical protein